LLITNLITKIRLCRSCMLRRETKMLTKLWLPLNTAVSKLNWLQIFRWVFLIKLLNLSTWILLERYYYLSCIVLFTRIDFAIGLISKFYYHSLQVPVLETPDGPVFESNAMARYGMLSL